MTSLRKKEQGKDRMVARDAETILGPKLIPTLLPNPNPTSPGVFRQSHCFGLGAGPCPVKEPPGRPPSRRVLDMTVRIPSLSAPWGAADRRMKVRPLSVPMEVESGPQIDQHAACWSAMPRRLLPPRITDARLAPGLANRHLGLSRRLIFGL